MSSQAIFGYKPTVEILTGSIRKQIKGSQSVFREIRRAYAAEILIENLHEGTACRAGIDLVKTVSART